MNYSGALTVTIYFIHPRREIKAVVRSYTLTHNEELNCTYLNKLCAIQFFIVSCCIRSNDSFNFPLG